MNRLQSVRHLGEYRLEVVFEDGFAGEIDLAGELWGAVFEPLQAPSEFAKAYVSEFGVLSWPNGADWDPDSLRELVLSNAAQFARQ